MRTSFATCLALVMLLEFTMHGLCGDVTGATSGPDGPNLPDNVQVTNLRSITPPTSWGPIYNNIRHCVMQTGTALSDYAWRDLDWYRVETMTLNRPSERFNPAGLTVEKQERAILVFRNDAVMATLQHEFVHVVRLGKDPHDHPAFDCVEGSREPLFLNS